MARARHFTYDQTGFRKQVAVGVLPDRIAVSVKGGEPHELPYETLTSVRLFAVPSKGCVNRGMAFEAGREKVLFERRDTDTASADSQQFFAAVDAVLYALQQTRPDLKIRMGVSKAARLAIFLALFIPAVMAFLLAVALIPEIGTGGLAAFGVSALLAVCLGIGAWKYAPWQKPRYVWIGDLRARIAENCLSPTTA